MEKFKLYKIGGCVRDKLLGIPSKDIDYAFVFEDINKKITPNEYFLIMKECLLNIGVSIYQERPDCFTIRGKLKDEDVDFVMARKESYPDFTSRIPIVEMGTLYDDQQRRDFTLNSIAEDEDGNIIDPFDGQGALRLNILRCPTDAKTSFNDDPLRMLRALRFSITKGFRMNQDILKVIHHDKDMWKKFSVVVSQERIREEVYKMFNYNTIEAINLLTSINQLASVNILNKIFGEELWLKPTNEKRR